MDDAKEIDRRLRAARRVLGDAVAAIDAGNPRDFEVCCRELVRRLLRVVGDVREFQTATLEAIVEREGRRLRRSHPR